MHASCVLIHPPTDGSQRALPCGVTATDHWSTAAGPHKLSAVWRRDARSGCREETQREEAMRVSAGARGKFAAACILGVILGFTGSLPPGAARAAELVVLTNQGATPGVRELAAAFARASGHKVTVIQEAGAALDKKLSDGPADLITSKPEPI